MAPLKSTRVAWSIALASLLLWATSVPLTWGQAAATSVGQLFSDATDQTDMGAGETTSQALVNDMTIHTTSHTNSTSAAADDAGAPSVPCAVPPSDLTPPTPPSAAAAPPGAREGTFHVCGADAQVARAIEQLISGRGFSASLSSQGDGCADLTIRVTSPASTSGRASSNLKVSLGSGQNLSIQIVSEGGATHVSLDQYR